MAKDRQDPNLSQKKQQGGYLSKRNTNDLNTSQDIFNSQGVANINASVIDLIRNSKLGQFGNFRKEIDVNVQIDKLDDRLSKLGKDLFHGKRILEVGCGNGLIALQIVKHFDVRSYNGVDIDYNLINTCLTNVKRLKKVEKKSFEKFSNKMNANSMNFINGADF